MSLVINVKLEHMAVSKLQLCVHQGAASASQLVVGLVDLFRHEVLVGESVNLHHSAFHPQ